MKDSEKQIKAFGIKTTKQDFVQATLIIGLSSIISGFILLFGGLFIGYLPIGIGGVIFGLGIGMKFKK